MAATGLALVLAPLALPVRAEPGSSSGGGPGAAAAPGAHPHSLDLQAESVQASRGAPITLFARVYDETGALYVGDGTFVRLVFMPGSPNDPGAAESFHLSCRTESAGWCSVTYTPLLTGRDVICARTWGGRAACNESVGAPERDDLVDLVEVIVRVPTTPAPTTAPTPRPTPTERPAPSPTAAVTPRPTPRPTARPTTRPGSSPTAAPTPDRTPTRTPGPPPSVPPAPTPDGPGLPAATPAPEGSAPATQAGSDDPSTTPSPALIAGGGGSGPGSPPDGAPAGGGGAGIPPQAPDRGGLGAAFAGFGSLLKPEAAGAVAANFGFPIALMVAVALFLLLQPRLDRRDPKLHKAPRTYAEMLLAFEHEVDL